MFKLPKLVGKHVLSLFEVCPAIKYIAINQQYSAGLEASASFSSPIFYFYSPMHFNRPKILYYIYVV